MKKPPYIKNSGKPWSAFEILALKQMARENTPSRVIGLKLGRPVGGVRAKAGEKGISLKPTNQSPYSK